MTSSTRSATSSGATSSVPPSTRITNSSPPIRPMVSASRSVAVSRSATDCSSRSPASWPSVSLTFLNPSRSRNSVAPVGAVAPAAAEQLLDAVHDQRPVRQTGQRIVQRLMSQLVGLFVDESKRPHPTGCQDEHQCRQQQAQPDTGQHQTQRVPVVHHTGGVDDTEGLDRPSVAEIDDVTDRPSVHVPGPEGRLLVREGDAHVAMAFQRSIQHDCRIDDVSGPSEERLPARLDIGGYDSARVGRRLHRQVRRPDSE